MEYMKKPEGLIPVYRGELQREIMKHYRSVRSFCLNHDIDPGEMSGVIRGWRFPTPRVQRALCYALALTRNELERLLLNGSQTD